MSSHEKNEFARGWPLLVGAALGIAAGLSSLYFYSAGIFIKPLAAEFGWSRSQASLGVLVGTIGAAAASLVVGRLVDRFGSRPVALASLGLLALGLALHGWLVVGMASFLAVTLFVNVLAAGSSPLPYTRLVAAHFTRNRGIALGIALSGTAVGAMVVPALLTPLVDGRGWRAGYLGLAVVVLALSPMIAALLPREKITPRGSAARLPLARMVASPGFVPLAAVFFFAAVAILGAVVQFVPMLTDAGLGAATAGQIAGLIGMAAMAGRVLVGALLDRLPPSMVTAGVFVLAAIGMVMLASGGAALAVPGALVLGLAIGAEVDLLAFHTARYFRPEHFGQANGAFYALFLVGAGLGPMIFANVYDAAQSYQAAFYVAAFLLAVSAIVSARLPEPGRSLG